MNCATSSWRKDERHISGSPVLRSGVVRRMLTASIRSGSKKSIVRSASAYRHRCARPATRICRSSFPHGRSGAVSCTGNGSLCWSQALILAQRARFCCRNWARERLKSGRTGSSVFTGTGGPGPAGLHHSEHTEGGGRITPSCTEVAAAWYAGAIQKISCCFVSETAEMAKLLENTFRMINIGLVNEMAIMCERMGVDVWEVIDAAATNRLAL